MNQKDLTIKDTPVERVVTSITLQDISYFANLYPEASCIELDIYAYIVVTAAALYPWRPSRSSGYCVRCDMAYEHHSSYTFK